MLHIILPTQRAARSTRSGVMVQLRSQLQRPSHSRPLTARLGLASSRIEACLQRPAGECVRFIGCIARLLAPHLSQPHPNYRFGSLWSLSGYRCASRQLASYIYMCWLFLHQHPPHLSCCTAATSQQRGCLSHAPVRARRADHTTHYVIRALQSCRRLALALCPILSSATRYTSSRSPTHCTQSHYPPPLLPHRLCATT